MEHSDVFESDTNRRFLNQLVDVWTGWEKTAPMKKLLTMLSFWYSFGQ